LTGVAREREVIVEHGILTPKYSKATSVEAALESGNASQCIAWIGVVERTDDELALLGRASGASGLPVPRHRQPWLN
jgi:hypothetical protein